MTRTARRQGGRDPDPWILHRLQDHLGEKTPIAAATITAALSLLALASVHPLLTLASAIVAAILARDAIILYSPRKQQNK